MKLFFNISNLIVSLLLAVLAYYVALGYFWTYWEDSPFGYETCGLEGMVWIFIIPEFLIVSFLIKLQLMYCCNYPKIFWIYPLIAGLLLLLFNFEKGYGQGLMCVLLILCEIIIAIYSFIKVLNKRKNKGEII